MDDSDRVVEPAHYGGDQIRTGETAVSPVCPLPVGLDRPDLLIEIEAIAYKP